MKFKVCVSGLIFFRPEFHSKPEIKKKMKQKKTEIIKKREISKSKNNKHLRMKKENKKLEKIITEISVRLYPKKEIFIFFSLLFNQIAQEKHILMIGNFFFETKNFFSKVFLRKKISCSVHLKQTNLFFQLFQNVYNVNKPKTENTKES